MGARARARARRRQVMNSGYESPSGTAAGRKRQWLPELIATESRAAAYLAQGNNQIVEPLPVFLDVVHATAVPGTQLGHARHAERLGYLEAALS